MQRGKLHTLLRRVADGDPAAKSLVVPKLADRLILVPTAKVSSSNDETKISVITVREGERKLIPIFTTMALLKQWLSKNEIEGEGLSMNCADTCMALGGGRWIMVDPGTEYWCEIDPEYVQQIADFISEDDDFFDDAEPLPTPVRNIATQPQRPAETTPISRTQEVPIVPQEMLQAVKLNPSSEAKIFPRFRHNEDEDPRATMDLTNFKKKFSS